MHSIISPAFAVWPSAIENTLSDCSPVGVNGASHVYSPHSDVCISSAGGFTHVEDAPESMISDGMSPAMVACRNCLVLSFAPYPAPACIVSNSPFSIASASASLSPSRISSWTSWSVIAYAAESGGFLGGLVGLPNRFWMSLNIASADELILSNVWVIAGETPHNNSLFDSRSVRRWQFVK